MQEKALFFSMIVFRIAEQTIIQQDYSHQLFLELLYYKTGGLGKYTYIFCIIRISEIRLFNKSGKERGIYVILK